MPSPESDGRVASQHGTITCRIDGVPFAASDDVMVLHGSNVVALSGSDAMFRMVSLGTGASTPGTFQIGGIERSNGQLQVLSKAWQAAAPGSGTIAITRFTSTAVAGTFQFTAVAVAQSGADGTRAITDGTFDIRF